jgi:hypothetical protein
MRQTSPSEYADKYTSLPPATLQFFQAVWIEMPPCNALKAPIRAGFMPNSFSFCLHKTIFIAKSDTKAPIKA